MKDSKEAIKLKQRTWASGDYSIIGSKLVIVSERLCESINLRLRANHRVLDVATGHGNTAIAAARQGCKVTGIDITPALLDHARKRAAAEHLMVNFQEGDLEDIPFPDETFDIVLSTFGLMFASNHHKAASELLRVCRTGGKIGLADWTLKGVNLAEDRAITRHFPRPADTLPNPWMTAEGLRDLFRDQASSLIVAQRNVVYRFISADTFVDTLFETFGPFMKMKQALDAENQKRFAEDFADAIRPYNESGDETLLLPCDYIETVITK
jgi:ubiquinone/menaquinone biosynthesis C-methylase UbiE